MVLLGVAMMSVAVSPGAFGADTGIAEDPTYGTLVAEDPPGDTTAPTPWLDVRELWFDSNGVNLTITIVLEDLRKMQPVDSYEVEFLNDRDANASLFSTNKDSLECDLGSMEPEHSECRYVYKHPGEGNEVRDVPFTVDHEADTIQATIPYRLMHAQPEDSLREIEVASQYDAEGPTGGAIIGEDDAAAPEPYELADGPATPDPHPEPLIAQDPAGDTRSGQPWLDLRALEIASNGEELTATIEVENLSADQRADRYDVRFTDGSEPSTSTYPATPPVTHDQLTCEVGGDPFGDPGCEYLRRDASGERTSQAVPMDVDFDANTITATIPYTLLGLGAGEELDVLQAHSWVNVRGTSIGDDTMIVDRTYVLAGEDPEPDPQPDLGSLLATDPAGDTRSGHSWLDLRTMWLASGDEALNVTLGLENLRADQYADRYDVRFTDGSEPASSPYPVITTTQYDQLTCDVDAGPFESQGCEYIRRDEDGSRVSQSVGMEIDLDADTLKATIPYDLLGLTAGEELEVLEAISWTEAGSTSTSEDAMKAEASYVLE